MASQLGRDEVARIAALANIDLSAEETTMFARQLADIVEYAATVQQADTTQLTDAPSGPTQTHLPPPRQDSPAPSLERKDAMAMAPDARADAGLFRVPKVL